MTAAEIMISVTVIKFLWRSNRNVLRGFQNL